MYATLVLGVCLVALLCYPLPGELESRLRIRGYTQEVDRGCSRIPSWKASPCHRPLRVSQRRVNGALPSSAFHPVLLRRIV